MRSKILFVSENVTLAQVVRLFTLARSLDPARYDVTFACADFDPLVFRDAPFALRSIHSPNPKQALATLRAGRRIYDARLLARQTEEDLALFEDVAPDLVVGDLRWSLAVSAPVYGVPHAALINAYWSPFAERRRVPVPDHPIVTLLGEALSEEYFPKAAPIAFSHFAAPLNRVRKKYGLSPIGGLFDVLTHGDYVLYADPPELIPTPGAPPTHFHLGAVSWAPGVALPAWWGPFPTDRPVVYATVGSSGDASSLPVVIDALGRLPVTAMVATAGRATPPRLPDNVRVAAYLPGDLAARRADVVVSNGGSATGYQALAEGTPLVGIASNLDQYLAMDVVEARGAGRLVKARTLTAEGLAGTVADVLAEPEYREAARALKPLFSKVSARERFSAFLEQVLPSTRRSTPEANRAPRAGAKPARRTRFRWFSGVALVAMSLPFAGGARAEPAAEEPPPAVMNEIRFDTKTSSDKGHVICALFRRSGWLKKPVLVRTAPIHGREATCVFTGLATDVYAICAFHDENDSGDIDKNFLGIPTEEWCTSRNAHAFFGPPSFGSADFVYKGGIVRLQGFM